MCPFSIHLPLRMVKTYLADSPIGVRLASFLEDDTRDRVDLKPLVVLHVLNPRSGDRHVRAYWQQLHCTLEPFARRLSIRLLYRELANNLEDEVPPLGLFVAVVEKLLLSGVQLQPAVGIPIGLVSNTVLSGILVGSRGIHNGSGHRDTLFLHDEA